MIESELGAPGDALRLHERYINPSVAAVLRTIGFDANYVRGEGAYLFDDQGRRYIDCLGGYAVFAAGRNHPVVRDALRQAMELDLPNLPGVGVFRTSGLLAKRLVELMPGAASDMSNPLDTVFFANSGAEAIDAAIKHARIATGRRGLVYCHRAYHGLTMGALSVNGNQEFREGFGPLLEHAQEIPFNDLGALEAALEKGDVAAFIVEPIQGKGVNIPAEDYLSRASALCRKHGSLLILDEIQTGLGRTGRMFACEHFNAGGGPGQWTPDIMVLAKALSGGYVPVSALITRRWIHSRVFPSMSHCARVQTTFGQNDLAMAAGLATLHVLEAEGIVENAAEIGGYLTERLREKLAGFQMVREIRGMGLMIAIEFGPPRSAGLRVGWELLHKLDASLFCQAVIMPLMSDHRILAQVAGHRLDVIKLIPPLVLSREDADEIVGAFEATVRACHQFGGPAWEVGKKLGAAAMKRFVPA
ncbi:MAG: aspartate aminotransferase family protein [Phycisphaerales bacterium]|nr:aspartate aminotransferase family protein [Phycisphaerales bacterium]